MIADVPFQVLIDTGASINVIDEKTFQTIIKSRQNKRISLSNTATKIYSYGGSKPLPVLGTFTTHVESKRKLTPATIYVIRGAHGCLLSYQTATELDLISIDTSSIASVKTSTPIASTNNSNDILKRYPDLFTGIRKMKDFQVELHIDPSVPPVTQPHRRIPFHLRKKLDAELDKLERQGIIEPVDGPTPWVSPLVVTPKPKNPDQIRVCVDMRQPATVNDAIRKLSEDILILKSKLSSFENLTRKVICHDHVNNECANESASITKVNDQCGLHDKDHLTNLNANMYNSRFIETSTKENPSSLNSSQVPHPHEKQRLSIDLTAQLKERINLTSNVLNDQCESQDNVQPTNQSINNSSFNEISTNENRLLFNSTQVPISHDNQRVTIDLTTKPKKGVNIIFNPQSDNENNLGNRHPRAKFNTSCPFLRRRGWCAKGNRCDFKHPHEKPKDLVPCPFLQKRRFCLKGTRCDFSHCATFPQSIQPTKPINYPTSSFFYDNRLPIVPQQRKPWPGYNQSAQWHPNGPGFFQFFPKPLMGTPLCPPYTFQVPLYRRARYAETLV